MVTAAAEAWVVTVEADRWQSEQQHGRAKLQEKQKDEKKEAISVASAGAQLGERRNRKSSFSQISILKDRFFPYM